MNLSLCSRAGADTEKNQRPRSSLGLWGSTAGADTQKMPVAPVGDMLIAGGNSEHGDRHHGQVRHPKTLQLDSMGSSRSMSERETRNEMASGSVYISEEYAMRRYYFAEALAELQVFPQVDCFAISSNHLLAKWWGPSSPFAEDSFTQSWAQDLLWANPPFSLLPQTVSKLKQDQGHMVLVAPGWFSKRWFQDTHPMSVREVRYPVGTKLFSLYGRVCKGKRWEALVVRSPHC